VGQCKGLERVSGWDDVLGGPSEAGGEP